MKKSLIAALIAATTLVPAASMAQDGGRGDRGSRGDRGGWSRSDNGGQRSDGGSWRQRQQQEQPAQAQTAPAPAPAPQQRQWRGNGGNNNNRFANGVMGQPVQQDRRGDWNRGDRGDRGQWNGNRGDRGDRGQWNGNRGDRGQWNGNTYRNDRNRWNNDNRSNWSNNWRRDSRYDWRNYRNRNRNAYRLPRYYAPRGYGYGYNRYGIGAILGSLFFSQNYWINDPFYYRLPPAYGPYRWVRYYNDALLVDIYTGQVVDVEYDIFW